MLYYFYLKKKIPDKQRPLCDASDHYSFLRIWQIGENVVHCDYEGDDEQKIGDGGKWHQIFEISNLADQHQRY